jgi:hypothetical protein
LDAQVSLPDDEDDPATQCAACLASSTEVAGDASGHVVVGLFAAAGLQRGQPTDNRREARTIGASFQCHIVN